MSKTPFIAIGLGTCGDIYPLLTVCRRLAEKGHPIIVITTPDFQQYVEAYGLPFYPFLENDYYQDIMQFENGGLLIKHCQRTLIERPIPELHQIVKKLTATRPNSVIICSFASAFAARTVADALSLRSILLHYHPIGLMPKIDPPRFGAIDSLNRLPQSMRPLMLDCILKFIGGNTIIKSLNKLRRQFQLLPIEAKQLYQWMNEGSPNTPPVHCVGLFPNWFAKSLTDWQTDQIMRGSPKNATLTDFVYNDNCPRDYQFPTKVQTFLNQHPNPIVFTFGTRSGKAKAQFIAALHTCIELNRPGIFLSPFEHNFPTDCPTNILCMDNIPLSKILPYARLFVHHGGIGSAIQAFKAGVPQLIRPSMGDQFDTAARVTLMGVGLEIPARQFKKRLTRLTKALLNDVTIHRNCEKLKQLISHTNPQQTLDQVERLIEDFVEDECLV